MKLRTMTDKVRAQLEVATGITDWTLEPKPERSILRARDVLAYEYTICAGSYTRRVPVHDRRIVVTVTKGVDLQRWVYVSIWGTFKAWSGAYGRGRQWSTCEAVATHGNAAASELYFDALEKWNQAVAESVEVDGLNLERMKANVEHARQMQEQASKVELLAELRDGREPRGVIRNFGRVRPPQQLALV